MVSEMMLWSTRRYTSYSSLSVVFGLPVESWMTSSDSSYSSRKAVGPTSTRRLPCLSTTCTAYPVYTRMAGTPSYLVFRVSMGGGVNLPPRVILSPSNEPEAATAPRALLYCVPRFMPRLTSAAADRTVESARYDVDSSANARRDWLKVRASSLPGYHNLTVLSSNTRRTMTSVR